MSLDKDEAPATKNIQMYQENVIMAMTKQDACYKVMSENSSQEKLKLTIDDINPVNYNTDIET